MLLENLVRVESLRVAQCAELHRLGDDGNVSLGDVLSVLEVVGDTVHEERDVVEQLVGRKDPSRLDRHSGDDAIEPAAHDLRPRGAKPFGEPRGEVQLLDCGGAHLLTVIAGLSVAKESLTV